MQLTIKGKSESSIIVMATDDHGTTHFGYLQANGGYSLQNAYDFTSETALTGDWSKMSTTIAITGFSETGKQTWYRSKKSNMSNAALYNGLTFNSEKNTYYCVFPNYGLAAFNDFTLVANNAEKGDILHLSYLKGEGTTVYQAADSINIFINCEDTEKGLSTDLFGRNSYYIYRSAAVYRPLSGETAIQTITAMPDATGTDYYTIQGIRVKAPQKGLYIRKGRKVVIK